MIRRWCVALVLAVALGTVGIVVRDPSASGRATHGALDRASHSSLTVSLRESHADLVVPSRRVGSEGTAKPLLLSFATLSAACAVVLFGTLRRRPWAPSSFTRAVLRVPCGLRAPPALRSA
jgi:hypothetical protein